MSEHATIENSSAVAALKGLRVALVVPSFSAHGGSERHLQMLLPALREAGAMVKVFSASSADTGVPGIETRQEALRDSMGPWSRLRQAGAVAALADEIAACADVVEFQRSAPISLFVQLARRLPTVLSVYTAEQTCPSGGRFLRSSGCVCERLPGLACIKEDRREGCLAFQDGRRYGWRDRLRAIAQQRRTRAIPSAASCITFNSRATQHCFERFCGKPRIGHVIHHPLMAGSSREERAHNRLTFVGRVETFKGVFDLLGVLSSIPECTLDVIGTGSALPALKERARASGLESRIIYHGWRERDHTERILALSTCMLAPSRWFEAWGMIGPEAIAQGCPVVAYDSGGIGEWCLPHFGTLVQVGDVNGLVNATRQWLARMAGGLDTSSWREEAVRRWGMPRFLHEYADALSAAMAAYKAAR